MTRDRDLRNRCPGAYLPRGAPVVAAVVATGLAIVAGNAWAQTRAGGRAVAGCSVPACRGFDWRKLAPGVYAAIRREPAGLLEHANSLVIVGERDVVVVDAQMTAAATSQLIDAIREVTRLPVRYVVNTHWHDDHVFGDAAYAAAFPGVEFISSAATRTDLETLGRDNRRDFVAALPDELALIRRHLASGTALNWHDLRLDGPMLDPATRRSYLSDLAQADAYLAEQGRTAPVLATMIVDDQLTLVRDHDEIVIINLGQTHTRGDLAVWLPRERILATGDAVSAIVPMASGSADLAHWEAALGRLYALGPGTVVPGHGEVQQGPELLERTRQLLHAVRTRAEAAYAPGVALEALRNAVSLEDLRAAWAADDPVRLLIFSMFFADPALSSVHRRLSDAKPG